MHKFRIGTTFSANILIRDKLTGQGLNLDDINIQTYAEVVDTYGKKLAIFEPTLLPQNQPDTRGWINVQLKDTSDWHACKATLKFVITINTDIKILTEDINFVIYK